MADDASKGRRKGTPMNQVMIVVEFEVKPEHRSQFIE
jgi:hypothetical protein